MPRVLLGYIWLVDGLNRRVGRFIMYGIFVMMGILLWSSISKTFFNPSLWTLELAQFAMVTYYILGGPYSIQLGSNVRMDLFYGEWDDNRKAWFDAFTIFFLIFYLVVFALGWPWLYRLFARIFRQGTPCSSSESLAGPLPRAVRMRRPRSWASLNAARPHGVLTCGRSSRS